MSEAKEGREEAASASEHTAEYDFEDTIHNESSCGGSSMQDDSASVGADSSHEQSCGYSSDDNAGDYARPKDVGFKANANQGQRRANGGAVYDPERHANGLVLQELEKVMGMLAEDSFAGNDPNGGQVLGREMQTDVLNQFLGYALLRGSSSPLLVVGNPGVGKTVLVRKMVQDWHACPSYGGHFRWGEMNAMERKDFVIGDLYRRLFGKKAQRRAPSKARMLDYLNEYFASNADGKVRVARKAMSALHFKHNQQALRRNVRAAFVYIVDEVDVLVTDTRSNGYGPLLHSLLGWASEPTSHLVLILVSNRLDLLCLDRKLS